MKYLQDLKIEVKLQKKVMSSAQTSDGHHKITLSDGEVLTTDMYIPTFGLIPNSSYVPEKFLNDNRTVKVDEFLKVKDTENVWAIGDVSGIENSQYKTCDTQSAYVSKSITTILNKNTPNSYKEATRMIPILLRLPSSTHR